MEQGWSVDLNELVTDWQMQFSRGIEFDNGQHSVLHVYGDISSSAYSTNLIWF